MSEKKRKRERERERKRKRELNKHILFGALDKFAVIIAIHILH